MTVLPWQCVVVLFFCAPLAAWSQLTAKPVWEQEAASHAAFFQDRDMPASYKDFDVSFYHLDLELHPNTTYVSGSVRILSRASTSLPGPLTQVAFELVSVMDIDSITAGGSAAGWSREGDTLFIDLTGVQPGTLFDVVITYHGTAPSTGFFSGLSTGFYSLWQSNVTWSLSEPWKASDWFPCKQDLLDKADSSWVFITTNANYKAGSNGLLTATVPLTGGRMRYEWKSRYPIAYYLISAAVAEYQDYSYYAALPGGDSVLVQNYVFDVPGCLEQYRQSIDETADFLYLFSELFGMYPYKDEKYGHCLAYLGGAMEHQTMTTTGDFNFSLISHELAHQWFGDKVTCATWNDIWINEGFATYGNYLAVEYLKGLEEAQAYMEDIHQYVMTLPGGSVYVTDAEVGNINRIFDGRLSYYKGAAILHMLRFEINNDSLFYPMLRHYMDLFADSNATAEDFKGVAETFTGRDFSEFFSQWFYGEGFPAFDYNFLKVGDTLFLRSAQSASTAKTPFFRMPVEYRLLYEGGDTLIRLQQDQAIEMFRIFTRRDITEIVPNPNHWSLMRVGSVRKGFLGVFDPSALILYPNPVTQHLMVEFLCSGQGAELRLTDMSGREILRAVPEGESYSFDVTPLARGTYILSLDCGGKTYTRLFVRE